MLAGSPVKKAYLFGSHSRGSARRDSDVDILVELDCSAHIGLGFIKIKNELEEVLKKPADLVSERALSAHILPFVETDRQVIYER